MNPDMNPGRLDKFLDKLEEELHRRYQECNDGTATPSNILLAVLNAVAEAKKCL